MPRISIEEVRSHKESKRTRSLEHQKANTSYKDGFKIQPAIGKTGGADNVGWELIPVKVNGPPWYLATKELAEEAISRHQKIYG